MYHLPLGYNLYLFSETSFSVAVTGDGQASALFSVLSRRAGSGTWPSKGSAACAKRRPEMSKVDIPSGGDGRHPNFESPKERRLQCQVWFTGHVIYIYMNNHVVPDFCLHLMLYWIHMLTELTELTDAFVYDDVWCAYVTVPVDVWVLGVLSLSSILKRPHFWSIRYEFISRWTSFQITLFTIIDILYLPFTLFIPQSSHKSARSLFCHSVLPVCYVCWLITPIKLVWYTNSSYY